MRPNRLLSVLVVRIKGFLLFLLLLILLIYYYYCCCCCLLIINSKHINKSIVNKFGK